MKSVGEADGWRSDTWVFFVLTNFCVLTGGVIGLIWALLSLSRSMDLLRRTECRTVALPLICFHSAYRDAVS